ncbi:MAG: T9SS C-terminal target domain-containing protein, partial [Bacteroidetes bacterium]
FNNSGTDVKIDTVFINVVQPPSANFSVSDSVINEGETVFFTNLSNYPQYSSWNFGNGNSSSDVNPWETYYNSGNYWPVLIVSNACGNDSASIKITVNPYGTFINNLSATEPSLYPVPAVNFVTIADTELIREIKITDVQGKTLLLKQFNSNHVHIPLQNLSSGIYFIQITTPYHEFRKKLIISNP